MLKNNQIVHLIHNMDNMKFNTVNTAGNKADLIFADYIYENLDFSWVDKYWNVLKYGGIFIGMTDYHSAAEFKVFMNKLPDANFVNWLIWKNEFGNFRKDRFRQCHDDIIIFSKGKEFKFYPDRVQVEKATAKSKGLNKSGRMTKLATSVITDICLTTVAKERISNPETGKLVEWQKPIALMDRLLSPFTDEGDLIIDPFCGSGTSIAWGIENNRSVIGIEYDKIKFDIAKRRIDSVAKENPHSGRVGKSSTNT